MKKLLIKVLEWLENFPLPVFPSESKQDVMGDFEHDFQIPLSPRFWF